MNAQLSVDSALDLLQRVTHHRWTPRVVNLALLVVLAASLAQWTWRFLPTTQKTPMSAPPPVAMPTKPKFEVGAITGAFLFGRAESLAKPKLEQIPISSLNVVLTGVMASGADSYALLSISGAPELPIGIGQEIVNGATLQEVYPDRIIIRRGGMSESLMLKESVPNLPAGSFVTGDAPTVAAGVIAQAQNNFDVSRRWLGNQMEKPEFLRQASIVPNAGGGFLVRSIQPGSLYEKFGLKVGDVIRSVNGQRVNSITDVMKIYGQVSASGQSQSLALEIVRAGRTENLNYNLQ